MAQTQQTRLRHERERRGWSRGYVAEQVGVDIATVGRWERDERLPHPHYRQLLCTLFELNAQELGLFSEPQERFDEKEIAEEDESVSELQECVEEEQDGTAGNEENGLLVAPQQKLERITDPHLPVPFVPEQKRSVASRLVSNRRSLLIGLGGLGATTLLAGGAGVWIFNSHMMRSGKRLRQLLDPNTPNWINSLAWSPDGRLLTAANSISQITTWNIEKDALIATYPTLNQWVNDVTWSSSNRIAAAIADGQHMSGAVQIWTFGASSPEITLPRAYPLRTVSWSPDGEYLACAGHNTQVEIWGPLSNNPTSRYLEAPHDAIAINRIKWSSDGAYLAAATDGGTVQIWEAATGKLKSVYRGHQERVINLTWCPREYLLASASADLTAQVWDALTGRSVATYRGHSAEIHGIDWSPDGKSIVSAGYDLTAQVWKADTGQQIARYDAFTSGLLCAIWSRDGQQIALGSKQQGIEIWQAPS